jgi:hypothetical protein
MGREVLVRGTMPYVVTARFFCPGYDGPEFFGFRLRLEQGLD